jgi:hypothetical protein
MLKESPRKVTCDHASLGVGKMEYGIVQYTPFIGF